MSKGKHLTLSDRIRVQLGLNQNMSFKQIAAELGKDPTTISKEVRNHRSPLRSGALGRGYNSCIHRRNCTESGVCANPECRKNYCKSCSYCNNYCSNFKEEVCTLLSKPPYVCNGCKIKYKCTLRKFDYNPDQAQKQYEATLRSSRDGCHLSQLELDHISNIVTPLLNRGHSPYHIWTNNKDQLMIDSRTLYNYINKGYLGPKRIDLPRAVRYRSYQKKKEVKIDKTCRIGRTLDDYDQYLTENPDCHYVEMDTVIGAKSGKCLLTISFPQCSFMMAFLRESNNSQSVIDIINHLYDVFGHDTFTRLFPVIITDNGSEFSNPAAIEFADPDHKIRRTQIFYARPNTPSDKPHVEKNHVEFRRICPKGSSFNDFTQDTVNLIFSHINSYARKKLNDRSPLQSFSHFFGEDLANKVGITEVPANDVILDPRLLRL